MITKAIFAMDVGSRSLTIPPRPVLYFAMTVFIILGIVYFFICRPPPKK
jgi:hypothetical protein